MEELYHNLMKIDPSVEVDVICYNTDKAKKVEQYRGITIYRVPCIQILPGQFALPNYLLLFWTIIKLSQKHSYDIVHSNTRFFDHSWYAPFIARILGAKAVLTDHCASHPVHPSKPLTLFIKLLDKLTTSFTSRFYGLVLATNNSTQQFIQSMGVKNSLVVYGGVDTKFFNPQKRDKVRSIPNIKKRFSDREVVITFLGRMIETKGPHLLMETARMIVKQYKHVHFVFAGNGGMYQKLNHRTQPERVYFTGALNKAEVSKLLANTDIFVHPSIHHEGFPNAILEAGASGCAVIATDKGGTRELIVNHKTGLLVKPSAKSLYTALVSLIEDNQMRDELGDNLHKKIEKDFDWRNIAGEFKKVLDQNLVSSHVGVTFSYKTKPV